MGGSEGLRVHGLSSSSRGGTGERGRLRYDVRGVETKRHSTHYAVLEYSLSYPLLSPLCGPSSLPIGVGLSLSIVSSTYQTPKYCRFTPSILPHSSNQITQKYTTASHLQTSPSQTHGNHHRRNTSTHQARGIPMR